MAVHAGSEVPWTAEQPQRREWSETRTNFGDKSIGLVEMGRWEKRNQQ